MSIAHLKLGKRPARKDILGRTLKMAKYIKALAPPPLTAGYIDEVISYPMFGNDILGDCVAAAAGHEEQRWTTYAGKPFTPTLQQVISFYSAISGYIPGQPNTDNGADPLTALRVWRTQGLAGHKIRAFVEVDPTNRIEVMHSINLFGACFVGLMLPVVAQNPITGLNGKPAWTKPADITGNGEPGSWGGHMVDAGQYGIDQQGNKGMQVVSWGRLFDMTWAFLATYSDECFAIVTEDWIEADGKSPSGFDLPTLLIDLALVTA